MVNKYLFIDSGKYSDEVTRAVYAERDPVSAGEARACQERFDMPNISGACTLDSLGCHRFISKLSGEQYGACLVKGAGVTLDRQ